MVTGIIFTKDPLSAFLGSRPLVFVGEASYCLYLLHFNFWNLIHDSYILEHLGLRKYDPWISYFILIGMALLALYFIEKPAQRQLRKWMGVTTVAKGESVAKGRHTPPLPANSEPQL